MNLIKYSTNKDFVKVVRTNEQIKRAFSTYKFTINKKFLDFLDNFKPLWENEEVSFNYQLSPLKQDNIELEAMTNPSSKHTALFMNLSQSYWLDCFYRMANNSNLIITNSGDTGSGKSRITLANAYWIKEFLNEVMEIDTELTVNNICFSRSDVVELVPKIKDYETVIMDEDNEGLLGAGSFMEHSQVSRFEQTLRSKSKNFFNNSPTIKNHKEHYILQSLGYNNDYKTNKFIVRERLGVFNGFVLVPQPKTAEYQKLVNDYEIKKKKFQENLEQNLGNEKRTQRMLDMAVTIILKNKLTYKDKNAFITYINFHYLLDKESAKELKRLMEILLDYRNEQFREWKDKIRDYIIGGD